MYGALVVQLCELNFCVPAQVTILFADQIVKMCIATTSRRTGISSNYWACDFYSGHSAYLNDGIFEAYGVFILETLQTALNGADMYYWFGSGFGNMDHLLDPYASAFDVPIIGSIVAGAVQFFFVYRVWVLSDRKSWWLCFIISVVSRLFSFSPINGYHKT